MCVCANNIFWRLYLGTERKGLLRTELERNPLWSCFQHCFPFTMCTFPTLTALLILASIPLPLWSAVVCSIYPPYLALLSTPPSKAGIIFLCFTNQMSPRLEHSKSHLSQEKNHLNNFTTHKPNHTKKPLLPLCLLLNLSAALAEPSAHWGYLTIFLYLVTAWDPVHGEMVFPWSTLSLAYWSMAPQKVPIRQAWIGCHFLTGMSSL